MPFSTPLRTMARSLGVRRLLLAVLLAAAVVLSMAGEEHSGAEEIMEHFDEDADGKLSAEEVGDLLEELVDDSEARAECPTAAALIAASDADSSNTLEGEEVEHMASELIPCLLEFQVLETLEVTADGTEYKCSPGAHGEGHGDEHDHRRRRLQAPHVATASSTSVALSRRLVPDVHAAGSEWECTAVEEEEEEGSGLSKAAVWGLTLLATFITCCCSLIGIICLIPALDKIRQYTDDVAACAMGALLAGVVLHMLPEAVAEIGSFSKVLGVLFLGGFLFAYCIEHVVHVSREAIAEAVEPECVHTADHQAHHGHHIPSVPAGDIALSHAQRQRPDGEESATSSQGVPMAAPLVVASPTAAADASMVDTAVPAPKDDVAVAMDGSTVEPADDKPDADTEPTTVAVMPETAVVVSAASADDTTAPAAPTTQVKESWGGANEWDKLDSRRSNASTSKAVQPMVYTIAIGDFFHNIVDGVLIGAAFLGCDKSLGWSVMAAIILHELPQELGDYVLLRHCGLTHRSALGVNFLSAMGAMIGAVLTVSIGMEASDIGSYLLAFGSVRNRHSAGGSIIVPVLTCDLHKQGTLLFIAATDILPPLMREPNAKRAAIRFGLMLVAMGLVSLTLLYDKHCSAGHDHHHH